MHARNHHSPPRRVCPGRSLSGGFHRRLAAHPAPEDRGVPFAYVAGSLAGGGSSFISNQTATKQTAGYNIVGSAYVSGPPPFAGSGTLDTTQASAAVVGHDTAFGTEVVVGDLLTINGQSQHVSAITDATHLSADGNWTANNNGFAYRVQKAVAQLGVYSTATPPPALALVVNDKGNVGISKTIPQFKLDVGGNLRFDKGLLGVPSLYQLDSVGYSATNPFPSQGVNTDWSGLMLNQSFYPTGTYHLGMSIYTDNQAAPTYTRARLAAWSDSGMTPDLELGSGGTIYLNGNVGVGTASPAAPLGVSGYLHVSGSTSPTVLSQGAYFSWNATGGAGETDFINQRGEGGGGFNFYNATKAGVIGSAIATINSAGVYTASDERLKNIRKSIPEAVVTDAEGHLSLTDRPIVSTLVNAVRELEDQNDVLGRETDDLPL